MRNGAAFARLLLELREHLEARQLQGGAEARDHGGEQAEEEGGREHAQVRGHGEDDGEGRHRDEGGHQQPGERVGEAEAQRPSDQGQHEAFGEELAHHAPPARTEGEA